VREPVAAAPDAYARTWREDLRLAIEEGVPLLEGAKLGDEGLPDLEDRATRRLYSRWLAVRVGTARAETVFQQGVCIGVLWEDGAISIDIPGTQVGCLLGGDDPYGPGALAWTGRWAEPSPADELALALRCSCAWSHSYDANLARLQELERASREAKAAPDAPMRTWVEELRLARESGMPVLPQAALRADGLPNLEDLGTRELYSRWLAVRLWMASPKVVTRRGARVVVDREEAVIRVEVPGLRKSPELGWNDPYGPRLAGWTGRWAAPSAEDGVAFALRCSCAWSEGPKQWLRTLQELEQERARNG
jgi:hypothetical protein